MNDAEFEHFVRDHQEKALRLAQGYLGDWDEARDAVQEALVKAYRKSSGFRGEAAFGSWFFRILVNHCRDRLRRRKVRGWLPWSGSTNPEADAELDQAASTDPAADPAGEAEREAFRRELAAALRGLPRRQREVFRLKALAGLTLSETAQALGLSVGTAKSHFFRASKALQSSLSQWRDVS